jgi:hypothetical protein
MVVQEICTVRIPLYEKRVSTRDPRLVKVSIHLYVCGETPVRCGMSTILQAFDWQDIT